MSSPSNNRQLFRKDYQNRDIYKKLLRNLLERKIIGLTRTHACAHRQLAVFAFDYISTQIVLDGLYELDELELFTKWLGSLADTNVFNGLAVDVGANIGNHSLYFSDFYTEVLALEPHPLTFKLLSVNSELASNVSCVNYGLSSEERSATLVVDTRNLSGARVEHRGNGSSTSIKLRTLDSVLKEASDKPVRLIKIDVEGHETEVLVGAESTIRNHQPFILFEQHASDFSGGSTCAIELLRNYGYENFACVEKFPRPPDWLPHGMQPIYSLATRLLVGGSIRIVSARVFKPKFHPFIIAIPPRLALDALKDA